MRIVKTTKRRNNKKTISSGGTKVDLGFAHEDATMGENIVIFTSCDKVNYFTVSIPLTTILQAAAFGIGCTEKA